MNKQLQTLMDFIQQNENISAEEKSMLVKEVRKVSSDLEIAEFKLERTEKVKRTTAILLEETIEELEQKRKAVEAQNRELEIEAALERIRSAAMSMRDSAELGGIIYKVYVELIKLDAKLDRCFIMIVNPGNQGITWWMAGQEGLLAENGFFVQLNKHPSHLMYLDYCKKRKKKWTYLFGGKEKRDWDRFGFSKTELARLPEPIKAFMSAAKQVHLSGSSDQFGSLVTGSFEPLPEEQQDIISRFTIAFNQAYIRFLDLKKAEAQARESEIQLALERVRARTMAMYKSSELNEVAAVLFEQIRNLGGKLWGTGFALCNIEAGQDEFWFANELGVMPPVTIPNTEDEVHRAMYQAWKEKKDYLLSEKGGEELARHYRYLNTLPQIKSFFEPVLEAGHEFPKWQQWHAAYFAKGYLLIITIEQYPEPDILKRFAKVFEQTYIRFLDLQKAEAQAREAQIEAALERVRSRTMGMQRSEELKEAAVLLFNQVEDLGVPVFGTGFNIWDDDRKFVTSWMGSRDRMQPPFKAPISEDIGLRIFEAAKKGETLFVEEQSAEELKIHYEYLNSIQVFKEIASKMAEESLTFPTFQIMNCAIFSHGYLTFITYEPVPNAYDIFKRFAKVFEQTYTRFLDLQKAEAQARESQIEAALERVRSRTMAMQHSDELLDVASILFQQVKALGVPQWDCGFNIWNTGDSEFTYYPGSRDGKILPSPAKIPLMEHPVFRRFHESRMNGVDLLIYEKQGKEQTDHYNYMLSLPVVGDLLRGVVEAGYQFPTYQVDHVANFSYGNLIFITYQHFPEMHDVFKRFAKVFEQTYTRFLDLQKAEAQAREAQIEAALERIRSKVTAMQESSELLDIVVTMRSEFVALGHKADYFWYMRYLPGIYEKAMTSGDGTRIGMVMTLPRHIHGDIKLVADWEVSSEPTLVFPMDVETAVEYVHKMITLGDFTQVDPNAPTLDDIRHIGGLTFVMARTTHGEIGYSLAGVVTDPPEEDLATLARFATVFDLAYRRFEDLKTSEKQNRETQIELALERVRARTMGMQQSDELQKAAVLLFNQVKALGVPVFGTGFNIWDDDRKFATAWMAGEDRIQAPFKTSSSEDIFSRIYEAAQKGESLFVEEQGGEALKTHYKYMNSISVFKEIADKMASVGQTFPKFQIMHCAFFSQGYLMFISFEPVPDAHDVFKRFAKVFEQTYTRFLDLQNAEAQAREAQIEASLERVRSKTMAMHSSKDVGESVATLFDELSTLGVLGKNDRCGIGIMQPDEKMEAWTAAKTDDGKAELTIGYLNMTLHPLLKAAYRGWTEKVEINKYILAGEDKLNYYDAIRNQSNYKIKRDYYSEPLRIVHTDFYFNEGCLYVFSSNEFTDESSRVLIRFAGVFGQTYRRYLDLKKAEAQAKEAIKASSLDRVRGEIASMRTVDDLQRITPIIWHELIALGVPFVRCGVFIIDDSKEHIQVHLSSPVGHSLGALDLPFDSSELTINSVNHWRKGLIFKTHWNKQEFLNFMQSMIKEGQVQNPETYQGAAAPPESLDLHFVPFKQGMLYVGNSSPLEIDELQLVKSLAESFSIAYARYEDFRQLEEAKNQIEKTFSDLKATQSQLIQSEKMASLGELTAGIAHEIQNPLNFVNNFSEVTNELIMEIVEERAKNPESRDENLVSGILLDIKQNLDKINHHGKRADAIVKGMLQHSRSSSGVKEPTDINALADEYLRLAYHGLRAKDKSFNAKMNIDFDKNIGKINVVPQDIGRVILNLITNAFYAVNEKKKATALPTPEGGFKNTQNDYEPTVTLKTSLNPPSGGRGTFVLISVADNGDGIPQAALDKIFQPFFTTKPTGQGTGLGLSMSYEIVTKGHSGELNVENKIGEGATFTIVLPV